MIIYQHGPDKLCRLHQSPYRLNLSIFFQHSLYIMDATCIPLAIHHHYLFDFENYHGHVLFIRELVFHMNFRLNFEVDDCD